MKKLLPRTSTKTQGFTLVELLVVISIIAILSVIGITVFSGVQKGARDAKRRTDVEAIATALEAQKISTSATYPTSVLPAYFGAGVVPTDPSAGAAYRVTWNTTNTTFCVCTPVILENGKGNATSVGALGVCVWSATGTYFCKASLQ